MADKLSKEETSPQEKRNRKESGGYVKDKKLRTKLKTQDEQRKKALRKAEEAEILLEHNSGYLEPETPLEKTYKVRQDDIKQSVGIETAKKAFELKLGEELGPYLAEYSRNGKNFLLVGRKGHVATIDSARELSCEIQLGETVRDAKWLHNTGYFALAQKSFVYIYDHQGTEIHSLRNHIEPVFMEFLPYHFLLASVGNAGYLKYTDTSTGQNVTEISTKLGTPTSLCQNPWNAVLQCGHYNGTVTLWSPNSTTPLVKLLAHKGPVRACSVDREGRYLVSAGQDRMAVWDIRTFKEVNNYFLRKPAASIAISDSGLVAVGWGTQTTIWRGLFSKARSDTNQEKVQSPYMRWGGDGKKVLRVSFCPFEDSLGIGHSRGFDSILIPGAGEANYDALEVNPFETTKQRQEAEVKSLLNKLQPEMISLNPDFVGNLDLASEERRRKEKDFDRKEEDPILKLKNRGRGRNSSLRKYLRKKSTRNIIDERREKIEALRKETNERTRKVSKKDPKEELGPALARFVRK